MAAQRAKTRVTKTASAATPARTITTASNRTIKIASGDNLQLPNVFQLTDKERRARQIKKYSTSTFGFNTRAAFSAYQGGDTMGSQQGNFYSPQLSTDFLEKPQNLRERRAWYRHFYNANEYVGQAIDLHSQLPLSKIRLEKPKSENQDMADYVYDFFTDMCDDMKLTKTLLEISHDFWLLGNCGRHDMLVRTDSGYKKLGEINPGEYVLTHTGRFREVQAKTSRLAKSGLSINTWYSTESLDVTEEHPIEVFRDGSFLFVPAKDLTINDYVRMTYPCDVNDTSEIDFLEGFDNIKKVEGGYEKDVKIIRRRAGQGSEVRRKLVHWLTDIQNLVVKTRKKLCQEFGCTFSALNNVITQLQKEIPETFHRRFGASGYQKGSQVEWIPLDTNYRESLLFDKYHTGRTEFFSSSHTVEINNDFLYLLGYWYGDGTYARDNSRKGVWGRGLWHITFGNGSHEGEKRIKKILENVVGLQNVRYHQGKNSINLAITGNPAFCEWWASNFGETSHGKNKKRIPKWIHDLPKEKLEYLLAGIIDSDGCVLEHGHTYGVAVALTSKNLVLSLRDMSMKCGSYVSFSRGKRHKMSKSLERAVAEYGRPVYKISVISGFNKWIKHSIKETKDGLKSPNPSYLQESKGSYAVKIKSVGTWEEDTVYNLQVEHDNTFQMNFVSTHNCFIFAEDDEPYNQESEEYAAELKEGGKVTSKRLYEEFKITDKDPNYRGWRRLIILPPDQVRIKKIPLSDESRIEFIPDPETRKSILRSSDADGDVFYSPDEHEAPIPSAKIPGKLVTQLRQNGSIPMDTDQYSGSYVYHLARKKSQYETMGVSILERCINTLLLQDKLRQAQTSIASRHMTPIRIVWAEELSEADVDNLREQVDLALVDPDFSIITNFQVNWEEMGSNGRLLQLNADYEYIENSLFAGLGVTREILTGEGTYAGNRITLEILNNQYMFFRELLQDYVENYLFKPIAKKKGFIEKDKYGREKLMYPTLSFTRLAIRDNDAFFDQVFQLYNKGSVSIDVILDMLNLDPTATKKKIEADLFTVNDFAFNQLLINTYTATGQVLAERYNVAQKLADYLDLTELPAPPPGAEEAGGLGGAPLPRFAEETKGSSKKANQRLRIGGKKLSAQQQEGLKKIMAVVVQHPEKLSKVMAFLQKKNGS